MILLNKMIEELSEPLNPKLKDPSAFYSACEDVSLTVFKSVPFSIAFQISAQSCMCLKWTRWKVRCLGPENLSLIFCMSLTVLGYLFKIYLPLRFDEIFTDFAGNFSRVRNVWRSRWSWRLNGLCMADGLYETWF